MQINSIQNYNTSFKSVNNEKRNNTSRAHKPEYTCDDDLELLAHEYYFNSLYSMPEKSDPMKSYKIMGVINNEKRHQHNVSDNFLKDDVIHSSNIVAQNAEGEYFTDDFEDCDDEFVAQEAVVAAFDQYFNRISGFKSAFENVLHKYYPNMTFEDFASLPVDAKTNLRKLSNPELEKAFKHCKSIMETAFLACKVKVKEINENYMKKDFTNSDVAAETADDIFDSLDD